MYLRPQKNSGQNIPNEYKSIPEKIEYYPSKYPQSLGQVDNFGEQNGSLTNLARKRPKRPPLPSQRDYSEYFQYFTVKEKTPSVMASDPEDEKIISSSLVRETSPIRKRKKVKRRRSRRNLEETGDADVEYYQPYEPEATQKSTEDEFAYEDRPIGKSSDDPDDESEDEALIELNVESDYSPIHQLRVESSAYSDSRIFGWPNIAPKNLKMGKVPLRILPLSDIYPYHHCKDQYSDEYASVPTEPFSKNQPRRNLRETFSQIFQKTRSLQNLRNNISNLGIYAQPKERFQITQADDDTRNHGSCKPDWSHFQNLQRT